MAAVNAPRKYRGFGGLLLMAVLLVPGLYLIFSDLTPFIEPERDASRPILGFVLWGLAFLLGPALGRQIRNTAAQRKLPSKYPGQPWRWRPIWAEARIEASDKKYLLIGWQLTAAVLPFALVSVPVLFHNLEHHTHYPFWPLVGLTLYVGWLTWVILCTISQLKFGQSFFRMKSRPGAIGGQLEGVIETSRRLPRETVFQLQLKCVNRVIQRQFRGSSVEFILLWKSTQDRVEPLPGSGPGETHIPVSFQIPSNLHASDDARRFVWQLDIRGEMPGIDYMASFEVPVLELAPAPSPPVRGKHAWHRK
jgi:hypothetical protein